MVNTSSTRPAGGEYGDVRASIDNVKLNAYLANSAPAVTVPVTIKQFKSNPTYFLTDARGARFVLRKKPAGNLVSQTAHQVEREYTVLAAIHKYNTRPTTPPESRVPVPQVFVLCEDCDVIGTPFYIMEFLEGRIFADMSMPGVPPKVRRECWLSAVRALGALSSLDPNDVGLENFGSHKPYFPRQIKSLRGEGHRDGKPVGDIPGWDELIAWYERNLPDERKTGGARIVHGDYKLDNLVFHPTENRVIGILDWELSTLGSPLVDLANLTQPWTLEPTDAKGAMVGFKNSPSTEPISLAELEREYCRATQQPYPITEMTFAQSWMLLRLAVISQGIAARHAQRQASSEQAHLYAAMFPLIGMLARRYIYEYAMAICGQK
ncbi:kinase-like protein [Russula vinacea]|nr:kinase-like protein [Russula vinacea]